MGYVAFYNRNDNNSPWMHNFAVYLGSFAGDQSSIMCGSGSYVASVDQSQPYIQDCGGSNAGTWITLKSTTGCANNYPANLCALPPLPVASSLLLACSTHLPSYCLFSFVTIENRQGHMGSSGAEGLWYG